MKNPFPKTPAVRGFAVLIQSDGLFVTLTAPSRETLEQAVRKHFPKCKHRPELVKQVVIAHAAE